MNKAYPLLVVTYLYRKTSQTSEPTLGKSNPFLIKKWSLLMSVQPGSFPSEVVSTFRDLCLLVSSLDIRLTPVLFLPGPFQSFSENLISLSQLLDFPTCRLQLSPDSFRTAYQVVSLSYLSLSGCWLLFSVLFS